MPSTLLTQTLPGAPDGMNQALPAQDLQDTEARYIQDALVDFPGLMRQRGPVQNVATIAQPSHPISGLVTTIDPQGTSRYGILNGNASNGYFSVYSDDQSALVDLAWPHPLPTAPGSGSPYRLVDSKPGLKGGAFIGTSSQYDAGSEQSLAYWLGANKANYTTGTISVARGSTALTGASTAWSGNVAPGMWVFANTDEGYTSTLVGYVLKVNSNTSITLGHASPYTISAKSYTFQALRGVYPRYTAGRVTCATTATDLNGGDTFWLGAGTPLNSGTWQVYRARDWAFIGKVTSVESDTHITLTANAAISMADEAYIAIRADGDWSMDMSGASPSARPGFMSATYAQRQFFLNNADSHQDSYRLAYTDVDDPETYDLGFDGTTDFVGSQSVVQESARGIAAAYNALLVMKENETFALTGTTPDTFSIAKILDDGVLSNMSIQPYGGGVIWAGRDGIQYYDGIQVNNLTADKLGDFWKDSIKTVDPTTYRMWAMVIRQHYVLHVEHLSPTAVPTKGGTAETLTHWVVAINMVTQAITMGTNVGIRGSIILPASTGQKVWYAVNDATNGHVASADDLFDAEGADVITSAGLTAGPDFYLETKKFDGGDQLRMKKWKLFAMHYLAQGGALKVDVVLGLNDFGQTLSKNFPSSVFTWASLRQNFQTWTDLKTRFSNWTDVIGNVFLPKRLSFENKSTFIAFRIYKESSAVTRVKLGPFTLGFKMLRVGRL